MTYPDNIDVKLGFNKIKELIKKECISTLGSSFVDKMQMVISEKKIRILVSQTDEFKKILLSGDHFPDTHYINVDESLSKAAIEGTFLTEEEFHHIYLSLSTISGCLSFLRRSDDYPFLKELTGEMDQKIDLISVISDKIDEKGQLRNNASPELGKIRKKMQEEQVKLRKLLNQFLRQVIQQGYSKEDANITIRNGRMVIPVLAEFKRRIKGFIHDESATGQMVYFEPTEVLDVNNQIRELENREKREIVKILTLLTDQLRLHMPFLKKAYHFLSLVDFIRAKAKFAIKINAIKPEISNKRIIDWKEARHPLLFLSHQAIGKKVVPLEIKLNHLQRILVISGPNAGGKSVCLKTVGLVQYMFQCGLLVPVGEESTVGIFERFFIGIGDEQSIENDLSTYSSHLQNMRFFLKHANQDTLFLIDEFGTGTDPNFGGAIAEAILELLHKKLAMGVVNTHYGNLKEFADKTHGIVNGAMRFDIHHLEPLYLLEIGKPGSSFALEIAYKIGLPHTLIEDVKSKIGNEKVSFDRMLSRLEKDKQFYEKKNKALKIKDKELAATLKKYNALKQELDSHRKKIMNEAKEEAQRLLAETNQKIEATIREIRETGAEKTRTKEVRKTLDDFRQTVKKEKVKVRDNIEVLGGSIEKGSFVRIKGQEAIGEVLSLKGKDAEVLFGELKSKIKLSRLEKVSKTVSRKLERKAATGKATSGIDLNEKTMNFSSQLDLRGKRADEAIREVDIFIDHALLLNVKELRIVHGKGDGILRQVIRDHLKTYSIVTNAHDEHADHGGSGVTIFEVG